MNVSLSCAVQECCVPDLGSRRDNPTMQATRNTRSNRTSRMHNSKPGYLCIHLLNARRQQQCTSNVNNSHPCTRSLAIRYELHVSFTPVGTTIDTVVLARRLRAN